MIITDPNLLRIPCEPILPEEVQPLISKLEKELEASGKVGFPGVGLAAPQIGIGKSAAIIMVENIKFDLINPKIIEKYNPVLFSGEGCLSFPGIFKNTTRYNEIVVESNSRRFILTGFLAIVAQHEIGHLNGELLIDFE